MTRIFAALLLLPLSAAAVVGQASPGAIVAALESEVGSEAWLEAVYSAGELAPEARDGALRRALISALERATHLVDERIAGGGYGRDVVDPETRSYLARVVAELQDTAAIPALVQMMGSGRDAIDGLVHFGAAAVPAVLEVLEAAPAHSLISGGAMTLRDIVRTEGDRLPDEVRARITRFVSDRLDHPGDIEGALAFIIQLAVTLEDPALTEEVRMLISDPNELRARGIKREHSIFLIQRVGREALQARGIQP